MKYIVDHVKLHLDETPASLRKTVAAKLGVSYTGLRISVVRREWVKTRDGGHIEARIEAETNEFIHNTAFFAPDLVKEENPELKLKHRPVVVGFEIKGVIAAYSLAKAGLKPIVLEKEGQWGPGQGDSSMEAGMLFAPDDLDPFLRNDLAEVGVIFDGVDSHQYLPPAFLRSMVQKLRDLILSLGGEIRFGAEYIGVKKFLGRIQGVHYLQNGQRTFQRASHVFLANGAFDDSHYLGFVISSSLPLYNEYIYGKPNIDARTPGYFLEVKKHTRSGVPYLFLLGLPKATLENDGKEKQRMSQRLQFVGKGKTAVSFLGVSVSKQECDNIEEGTYLLSKGVKVPYSMMSDFRSRRDPLKLGSVKPSNVASAQLVSMHHIFGSKVGDNLLTALVDLSRPFPFLRQEDALVGGVIGLHGCSDPNRVRSEDKCIHPIAVLPEKSIDFAAVSSASYAAVRGLITAARKAH